MKKIMSLFLSLVLVASMSVTAFASGVKSFDDVDPTRWSHNAIMICVEKGAISGTRTPDANGVGSFNPTGKVTLGQFLAVITRLVCPDAIKDTEGHWALKNYNAAVESGVIKATDFHSTADALNSTLAREDMAFIMVGAAKVNGEELKAIDGIESIITDYNSISGSRKDAVLKCYSNGLIAGYSDGSFGYADTMTREQMATVVCRLMKYQPRAEVKFEEEKAPVVQNSDYFYESGMVKREVQIDIVKDNFNNVRLYKNSNGELCVDVSAVSLPKELANAGWTLGVTVAPLDISGVGMDIDSSWYLGSGESVSNHVVKLYGDTVGIKVSDFSRVTVAMNLYHKDHMKSQSMIYFTSISDKTNVVTGFYRYASNTVYVNRKFGQSLIEN
ncbi:MAG: S-layer homology domain-containing protein [Bacillota bacterium]|nr:S-layer homology domain-containing protein [Bacillota bacterium]